MQAKAVDALKFLNSHPALNYPINDGFFANQCFFNSKYSKYGEEEIGPCIIHRDDPEFEKFKDRFEPDDTYIYVNHQEKYGEPWSFDHVRYYYDVSFFVFVGDLTSDKDNYDIHKWDRYSSVVGYEKTFEEMLINCAAKIKEFFGDYDDYQSLLTEDEKTNNNSKNPFQFIPSDTHEKCFSVIHNPDYFDVTQSMINRRWLRAVYKNEWFQKNWPDNFDKLIENTSAWVWDLSKKEII